MGVEEEAKGWISQAGPSGVELSMDRVWNGDLLSRRCVTRLTWSSGEETILVS